MAGSVSIDPWRSTTTGTVVPGLVTLIAADSWFQSRTARPPKDTTRSRGRRPAFFDGDTGSRAVQTSAAETHGETRRTTVVAALSDGMPTPAASPMRSRNVSTRFITTPATMTTARRRAGWR